MAPKAVTALTDLDDLPPDEVERYFASADPERIVDLVDGATNSALDRLAAVPHVRRAAVGLVIARLGEFAVPARMREVRGVVAFEVAVPRSKPERHALHFDGNSVLVAPPGELTPDVTIRTGVVDFLRLVSGGVNAAILLLGGRLEVDGDEDLALRVGGVFQVPGQPGVAVDPATVDPDQVAVALRGVRQAQLRRVMAGGFRAVVLTQVRDRFPEFLDQERAAGRDLSVGFKITGRPDGGADRFVARVADGRCRVEQGGRARDATLVVDGADFLRLVTGHLNPVIGVMKGALKVRGDVAAALELHRVMRVPGQP